MCNPRYVRITATRQLDEAWQREVTRVVSLQENVRGEARVRQPLGATVSRPALRALESALAGPASGWVESDEGYRFDVEGGYAIYHPDDQSLEVVAYMEAEVRAEAEARDVLEGRVTGEVTVEAEGHYYDDGWGGHNEASGRRAAEAAADQRLAAAARARVENEARETEARASSRIEAAARSQAEEELRRRAAERQAALAAQARRHLEIIGVRARQAFHGLLAQAYRDAILAYARQHQAEGVQCHDDGEVVEIEFSLRR